MTPHPLSMPLLALLIAPGFAACSPAPQAASLISWSAAVNGDPKSYTLDGYAITLAARQVDGDKVPSLHVRAPSGEEGDAVGVSGLSDTSAVFGVGPVDKGNRGDAVIFTSFSGGAHCCTDVQVLVMANGGWTTIAMGSWDGGGLGEFPSDIDGDGYADFVFSDDRFAYAFTDYADSLMPPRIYEIRDGAAADVSASGRYRALFEKDMQEAEAACRMHNNGGCAAFAADAARLGDFDRAWKIVLENYDRKSAWQYPAKCKQPLSPDGTCPKDAEEKFADFPEALTWFLTDTGYIAAK